MRKADNQIIAQIYVKLITKWDKFYNPYKAWVPAVQFPSSVTVKKIQPTNKSNFSVAQISVKVMKNKERLRNCHARRLQRYDS